MSGPTSNDGCLAEVLSSLKSIQQTQSDLVAAVESLNHRYQQLAGDADVAALGPGSSLGEAPDRPRTPAVPRRVLLIGINPLPMKWGELDPHTRGPVVVSRSSTTIGKRNGLGGSYSIYYALAVASKQLNLEHRPDFTNTEPAANIGPFPQWGDPKKIVAMDPWGHLAPWLFKDTIEKQNGKGKPAWPPLSLNEPLD
ncbi:uracil-regulated protein 1 [Colletotrichum liriopes]|uniref:Uracil-regulated protein 1 n=1 Tax=Colletotrichum liriopes TaxID=708192 RepID=A0AA37GVW6_9PEZI|nr:uracil-regulated protein 1 [Colletotrichum liriopes]